MHIFPYSPRPGTKSHEMKNNIDNKTKKIRVKKLRELRAKKRAIFYEKFIGKNLTCLIEMYDQETGAFYGTSSNYVQCQGNRENLERGMLVTLIGERIENENLFCK